jgi:putative ABC transport system ATP-binding protein
MNETIISCRNLGKSFNSKQVIHGFDMDLLDNSYTCIVGVSGSGKSTLLNMIGLLEKPTEGDLYIFGKKSPTPFSISAQKILKEKIGYLFQNFALIDNMTVMENLEYAVMRKKKIDKSIISDSLDKVGLHGFENKYVYQCSGGEQQRIAIARLLIKPCEIVLCDEPTGSLDDENKKLVLDLIDELHKMGKTIVVVTHDKDVVERAQKVIELKMIR